MISTKPISPPVFNFSWKRSASSLFVSGLRKTGIRSIAVAGGVFSNVKFNQRVHELEEVDNFFVHPAMDDSGLAVGGAFRGAGRRAGHWIPSVLLQRLKNVYFGTSYSGR